MDFEFVIFDTTQIENHDIIKSIDNLYLSASLLLMKNIFKDIKELKPILKEIVTLDDDRIIRLFEYIVVNKDIEKDEFNEILLEVKGEDKMSTLAQRWMDEGRAEGMQQGMQRGIQQGIFETAIRMIERFNLSVDEVIKELNLKKEELLEYMQSKNK
jgi:predicted transposase YdaD